MTARVTVSDGALEAMLHRRAARGDPGDLRNAAFTAIESTEPRRGIWPRWPIRPVAPSLGFGSSRLVWVLTGALLILLAGAAVLVGAGWLGQQERTDPFSVQIESLSPDAVYQARVVMDGAGAHWAIAAGYLTRFDPASGDHTTWAIDAGPGLLDPVVAPARAGGVWIWSGTAIHRFTGTFEEMIEIGSTGVDLAEAPDGTLWAILANRGLERWDGSRWIPAPAGGPRAAPGTLLVRDADDVWVAASTDSPGVWHLTRDGWTGFDVDDGTPAYPVGRPVVAADGSIWVGPNPYWAERQPTITPDPGVGRFDGERWTIIDGPGSNVGHLAAGSDGSVWATGTDGAVVARHDDEGWTVFDATDGFDALGFGPVSVTAAGTFVGAAGGGAGLFRFAGDRWVVVLRGMLAQHEPESPWFATLLAVSADEAWTADDRGIWHFVDGEWHGPTRARDFADSQVRGLALGPDGALWIATGEGVAVLREGDWVTAWESEALTIAVAPDGTVWTGDHEMIVNLAPDGDAFSARTIDCPRPAVTLAVDTDGSVWVGGLGYSGAPGLARFDGQTCELVDPLGLGTPEIAAIAADPGGGVVVHLFEDATGSYEDTTRYVARFDGDRWTVLYEANDGFGFFADLAVTRSGAVVRLGSVVREGERSGRLERFDGEGWVAIEGTVGAEGRVSSAPDGTIWYDSPSGIQRVSANELAP